ncbi:MAG: hypothetical protein K2X47_10365 [Bdellovibrionales bacterium]|nr:hypothetical protein [Bdellovibrionales bacterium]
MGNFVLFLLSVLGSTPMAVAGRVDQICKTHRPSPFASIDFQRQEDAFLKPARDLPDVPSRRATQKLLERRAAGRGEQMTPREISEYRRTLSLLNRPDPRKSPPSAQFDPTSESFSPLLILRQKMQLDFQKIRDPFLRAEYLLELKNQVRQREINPDIIDELRDDLIEEENLRNPTGEKENVSEFQKNSQERTRRAELHLTMKEACLGSFEAIEAIRRSPDAKLKIQALANCATTCTNEAVGRVLAGAGIALGGWLGYAATTATVATAAPVLANPTLAIVGGGVWLASHALYEKSNFRGCVQGCENNRSQETPKDSGRPAPDSAPTQKPSETSVAPKEKSETTTQAEPSKPKAETKSETTTPAEPATPIRNEIPTPQKPEKSNPGRSLDSQVSFEEALDQAEAKTLKQCLVPKKENQRVETHVDSNSQKEKLKTWMNPFSLGNAIRQLQAWAPSEDAQNIGPEPIQKIFEQSARTARQWPALSCASKRNFLLNGGQINDDLLNENDLNCLCTESGDLSDE